MLTCDSTLPLESSSEKLILLSVTHIVIYCVKWSLKKCAIRPKLSKYQVMRYINFHLRLYSDFSRAKGWRDAEEQNSHRLVAKVKGGWTCLGKIANADTCICISVTWKRNFSALCMAFRDSVKLQLFSGVTLLMVDPVWQPSAAIRGNGWAIYNHGRAQKTDPQQRHGCCERKKSPFILGEAGATLVGNKSMGLQVGWKFWVATPWRNHSCCDPKVFHICSWLFQHSWTAIERDTMKSSLLKWSLDVRCCRWHDGRQLLGQEAWTTLRSSSWPESGHLFWVWSPAWGNISPDRATQWSSFSKRSRDATRCQCWASTLSSN